MADQPSVETVYPFIHHDSRESDTAGFSLGYWFYSENTVTRAMSMLLDDLSNHVSNPTSPDVQDDPDDGGDTDFWDTTEETGQESSYVFESGASIEIGEHGKDGYLYHSGKAVANYGASTYVFESGTGLGGASENIPRANHRINDMTVGDGGLWDGLASGDYSVELTVRPHQNYSDVELPDELRWRGPNANFSTIISEDDTFTVDISI